MRCETVSRLIRVRPCLSDVEAARLLSVVDTFYRPVIRQQFRLPVMKMSNCRLDPSSGERARLVDDSSFFCLSYRIGQPGSPDTLELLVCGIDYPLQIRLEMLDQWSGIDGNRRQLSRPQSTCDPRGAIDRRVEGRDLYRFPGSSSEALSRRVPTEDCHHASLPSSAVTQLRCWAVHTAVRDAEESGELWDHLHLGTVSGWLIQDFSSSWMKCARYLPGRESCSAPTPSRRPPTSPRTETPLRPGSARPGVRHCVGPCRPGNSCATNLSIAPSRSSAVGTSADGV